MRQYFKGYYFKCDTGDETVALIPALHNDGKKSSASLQIITGNHAYVIPYSKITFCEDEFKIALGRNVFSKKGIVLDINTGDCRIYGKLKFGPFNKIKYDIMGPFRYVPFMQCRHKIVSMYHFVNGKINIGGSEYLFRNGVGYIEGDRGCSFPEQYIWTQCHFTKGSIMLSVADIPLCGFHFMGIIGIVMIAGIEYRIATYLGARVVSITDDMVVIKQGKYRLSARLVKPNHQKLNAPVNGKMSRMIHESAACEAWYRFTYHNKTLLNIRSKKASFEYEMEKQ